MGFPAFPTTRVGQALRCNLQLGLFRTQRGRRGVFGRVGYFYAFCE